MSSPPIPCGLTTRSVGGAEGAANRQGTSQLTIRIRQVGLEVLVHVWIVMRAAVVMNLIIRPTAVFIV